MKRVLKLSAALSLAASFSLAGNIVEAVKVDSLKGFKCGDKLVKKIKWQDVVVYPQTTVELNDKKANEINKDAKAKVVNVGALTDGKDIAIVVRWPDKSKDVYKGYKSDIYADGFAVQFASSADKPKELPYIGMGSDGRAVAIYISKAYDTIYEPNGHGDVAHQVNPHNTNYFSKELKNFEKEVAKRGTKGYQKAFVSEGFRSMTEIKDNSVNYRTDMHYVDSRSLWGGTVIRPVKDSYVAPSKGEYAVAIAIWDGKELHRDGLKRLSGWVAVKLPKANNKELESVVTEQVKGDVNKGKELAMANCASCHRWSGAEMAPKYMAPGLYNIGGQATAAYIKESILKPSAVVVPGYNRNAHRNFSWYTVDEKGNRVSTMPPFDYLQPQEIKDIVAYMQTLKAEVEK